MKILFYIVKAVWATISYMPMGVLYAISNAMFVLMYHVVRYRRKMVHKNLTESFPEKSAKEIKTIERQFFHFFCNYLVETQKGLTMSRDEVRRRMRFENTELIDEAVRNGHSVSVYLGHYCNWEWITSLPLHVDDDVQFGQLYHPLSNDDFDNLMRRQRERYGAVSIPKNDVLLYLRRWKKEQVKSCLGYISDQAPKMGNIHHFTDFLGHKDTPVFTGAERLSRMFNDVVLYGDVRCEKRGHYVCRFVKITDDAGAEPLFSVTDRYMELLEQTIRRAPQYWLWTHNRWKANRTREAFEKEFGPDECKRRLSRI